MNLHFYTREKSSYSYNSIIELMDDEKFVALNQETTAEDILNSD